MFESILAFVRVWQMRINVIFALAAGLNTMSQNEKLQKT